MPKTDSDGGKPTRGGFSRRLLIGGALAAGAGGAAGALVLSRTEVGVALGRSRARSLVGADRLPAAVDVVVIGGGFVGASAALTLAERGVSVALCEKGVVAGEASGRSMGFVYSQWADPAKMGLLERSKTLWAAMNARTGLETGYRRTGVVAPLAGPEQAAYAEAWLASVAGAPGVDGRVISKSEIARLFPAMRDPPDQALLSQTDASVEPVLAAPAIAEAAQRKGAIVLQNCAARGLETSAGRVSGVVTERGVIACKAVILAGGAWSPMFARSVGAGFRQVDVFLSMLSLSPVAGPEVSLSSEAFGFRRQIDGGYSVGVVEMAVPLDGDLIAAALSAPSTVQALMPQARLGFSASRAWDEMMSPRRWKLDRPSPFEARRILEPIYWARPPAEALAKLIERFPVFAAAQIRDRWAGAISTTIDNMPVISEAPRVPGLFIGSGFANGLTFGPAAGEALADLATGRAPSFDLGGYRMSRFTDGGKLAYHS
ncbi:glycine/D-amino acid oxidase, deaminating [Caulobacter sp. AP07]|uniref:NAD(P)/FAD-dependent oxidoreductase n=1 Tax=Caulobacter sp. AP07 TaxID=1144304 RepID=UPI0002720C5B|nr:FAD-binding oxidoreductase [Caulobacter sp. AP07]EJL27336.1 glycine/D-amino acid oxidase, deaminating [Caulobacter sp. AP07]